MILRLCCLHKLAMSLTQDPINNTRFSFQEKATKEENFIRFIKKIFWKSIKTREIENNTYEADDDINEIVWRSMSVVGE